VKNYKYDPTGIAFFNAVFGISFLIFQARFQFGDHFIITSNNVYHGVCQIVYHLSRIQLHVWYIMHVVSEGSIYPIIILAWLNVPLLISMCAIIRSVLISYLMAKFNTWDIDLICTEYKCIYTSILNIYIYIYKLVPIDIHLLHIVFLIIE